MEASTPERAVTRVDVGGKMSNRKGVSLPDTDMPVSAMTPKDRADLEAALDDRRRLGRAVVRAAAEDVIEAKKLTRGRAAVMAKIEKPQAIARLADILEVSDALMVARGDLGVELPLEKVPGLQKHMTVPARTRRQAGGRRHPDAGIDDPVPGADARGGLRRGDRRVRRRRRHHAVG